NLAGTLPSGVVVVVGDPDGLPGERARPLRAEGGGSCGVGDGGDAVLIEEDAVRLTLCDDDLVVLLQDLRMEQLSRTVPWQIEHLVAGSRSELVSADVEELASSVADGDGVPRAVPAELPVDDGLTFE